MPFCLRNFPWFLLPAPHRCVQKQCFCHVWKVVLCSSGCRYYRNESMFDEDEGYSFTLTFTLNFPHDNDTVYLAHCYPYTYRQVTCSITNADKCNFLTARSMYRLLCCCCSLTLAIRSKLYSTCLIFIEFRHSTWIDKNLRNEFESIESVSIDLKPLNQLELIE